MTAQTWPPWWDWELELSPHVLLRMVDRQFSETDLRGMLADASRCHGDADPGRWVVETTFHHRPWEVIIEPDFELRLTVVVTAYPVG